MYTCFIHVFTGSVISESPFKITNSQPIKKDLNEMSLPNQMTIQTFKLITIMTVDSSQRLSMSWHGWGLRKHDSSRNFISSRLTVKFIKGRVVQTGEMLSKSRSVNFCFCFCFARYSAQLRGTCQTESLLWTITRLLDAVLSYLSKIFKTFLANLCIIHSKALIRRISAHLY